MSWIAFTVDLEEWFHLLDTDVAPGRESWEAQDSRVEKNTRRLLELMGEAGVRGTFFTLGWVAERFPGLVREVAAAGHEIASHGHEHLLAYEVGREAFGADARRSKDVLEQVTGAEVLGYRAGGFSITSETPWAFDELAEAGFRYDSSVFPARRAHGGFLGGPGHPHRVVTASGAGLVEFPLSPLRVGPVSVPFSGGGYLRLFPAPLVRWGIGRLLRRGVPANVYVHPREVDPGQPRLPLPLARRFRSYVNLRRGEAKIRYLLSAFSARTFWPLREALAVCEGDADLPEWRP